MKESRVAGGRTAVYCPDHPKANSSGYVLKARFVMEKKLGRLLSSNEEVHHKDRNKLNDSEDNLELLSSSDHAREHGKDKRKLNYELISSLMKNGFGYKKISKIINKPLYSVKSACRVIKRLGA